VPFFETSAKEGMNVEEAFIEMTRSMIPLTSRRKGQADTEHLKALEDLDAGLI